MKHSSSVEKSSDNVTQTGGPVNPRKTKKSLVKAAGLVGLMTFFSRVLGMVRDIVSARQFGTSWQWDGFVYAFMFPNFFRRLVGEGALSSAFIPVYNETMTKEGKQKAFEFANVLVTFWAVGITALILVVEVVLQLLIGTEYFGERAMLTFGLLRVLFPYLLFVSLYAISMGILNSHKHFLAPAFAPMMLNVFWIAGIFLFCTSKENFEGQLYALAWVLLAAGIFQLLLQLPPLLKAGYRFRWIFNASHTGFQKVLKLLTPAILGFAVMQINILVDMSLAFIIGPGAGSSLWYGTRLMQFPLGVFAIAMGTALLPTISQQVANKEMEAAKGSLSFAMRSVFLVILPCSVGLMVLSMPIVDFLFARGQFDAESTARTSAVLFFYSIGLFAYSAQKLLTSGFHAIQDTKTPVKIGVVALLANIVFNLILMHPLREAGLALATSISGTLQFGLMAMMYHKKITNFPFRQIGISFFKILAATVCMGFSCYFIFESLHQVLGREGLFINTFCLFTTIASSAFCYLIFCFLFRIREMQEAWNWILKKRTK